MSKHLAACPIICLIRKVTDSKEQLGNCKQRAVVAVSSLDRFWGAHIFIKHIAFTGIGDFSEVCWLLWLKLSTLTSSCLEKYERNMVKHGYCDTSVRLYASRSDTRASLSDTDTRSLFGLPIGYSLYASRSDTDATGRAKQASITCT